VSLARASPMKNLNRHYRIYSRKILLAKRRTFMLVARTYLNICSKTHVSMLGFAAFLSAICCWNTYVLMHGFARRVMTPIPPCLLILVFLCYVLLPCLKIIDSLIHGNDVCRDSEVSIVTHCGLDGPVVEFQLVRFYAPVRTGYMGQPVFGTMGTGYLPRG